MKPVCKTLVAAALAVLACNPVKAQQNMENVLTERQQCIVAISSLEAKGDIDGLKAAINAGLDAGLTVNQIKEALSQLYAYTGFPRSLNALGALQGVLEERGKQGIKDEEGRDASPMADGYDALRQGTEVQTRLSGRPFNYTFAPATDYYLKAHLFGDIFARDNLTFAQRELVTSKGAALSLIRTSTERATWVFPTLKYAQSRRCWPSVWARLRLGAHARP